MVGTGSRRQASCSVEKSQPRQSQQRLACVGNAWGQRGRGLCSGMGFCSKESASEEDITRLVISIIPGGLAYASLSSLPPEKSLPHDSFRTEPLYLCHCGETRVGGWVGGW